MATVRPASTPGPGSLVDEYVHIRARTVALIEGLSAEDCVAQSMPDASPVKWHLAHVTWFFEVFVLEHHEARYRPFDPAFRILFNSYYNAVGDKHPRPERGLLTRPSLENVLAYRRNVDERMVGLLAARTPDPEFTSLVMLGLNHEEQHQELLLTDLKHLLSRSPLRPAYRRSWKPVPVARVAREWIGHSGGLIRIGHHGEGFAFDNEAPRHQVFVAPFELSSQPVSHGDVIDFIDDDGYRRSDLWLSLGWDTVVQRGWQAPLYWERHDDRWCTFSLHGLIEVSRDVPATHLSYFEADAIARWSGARLPTEVEWEHAAAHLPIEGNLFESGVFHPLACSGPARVGGPLQMFGDVWEWTASAYLPYPGFRTAPGAVGEYNGKFMCNQFVLRGGSCATPQSHIRATYRNFFPPDARWQFSGARLARDA